MRNAGHAPSGFLDLDAGPGVVAHAPEPGQLATKEDVSGVAPYYSPLDVEPLVRPAQEVPGPGHGVPIDGKQRVEGRFEDIRGAGDGPAHEHDVIASSLGRTLWIPEHGHWN